MSGRKNGPTRQNVGHTFWGDIQTDLKGPGRRVGLNVAGSDLRKVGGHGEAQNDSTTRKGVPLVRRLVTVRAGEGRDVQKQKITKEPKEV